MLNISGIFFSGYLSILRSENMIKLDLKFTKMIDVTSDLLRTCENCKVLPDPSHTYTYLPLKFKKIAPEKMMGLEDDPAASWGFLKK